MDHLRIEVERLEAGTVVKLIGEGHVDHADLIAGQFEKVIAGGPCVVVVDLSQLSFASSLVMGALVKLRGQMKKQGGSMRLAALQADVAGAFRRARLDWAIPTFETVEQAIAV